MQSSFVKLNEEFKPNIVKVFYHIMMEGEDGLLD